VQKITSNYKANLANLENSRFLLDEWLSPNELSECIDRKLSGFGNVVLNTNIAAGR